MINHNFLCLHVKKNINMVIFQSYSNQFFVCFWDLILEKTLVERGGRSKHYNNTYFSIFHHILLQYMKNISHSLKENILRLGFW